MPSSPLPRITDLKVSEAQASEKTLRTPFWFENPPKHEPKSPTVTVKEVIDKGNKDTAVTRVVQNRILPRVTSSLTEESESTGTASPCQRAITYQAQFGIVEEDMPTSLGPPIEEQLEQVKAELATYKAIVAQFEEKMPCNGLSPKPDFQDSTHYWNKTAATQLDARLLAKRVRLKFPAPGETTIRREIKYPIFRLIAVGEDTPDNIAMLLGPSWRICAEVDCFAWRLEALAMPNPLPPGHWNHIERMQLTEATSWAPRVASAPEIEWLTQYGAGAPQKYRESVSKRGTRKTATVEIGTDVRGSKDGPPS